MKGIALKELAYLILAVVLVLILLALFFLYQSPFMIFPIVLFDHLSTFVRGFVVAGIWTAFWAFVDLFTVFIWVSMANPSCWGPQAVGCAVKNLALEAIFVTILASLAFYFTSAIPLVYVPVKLQVDNVSVNNHLAEWVMDTSYMLNRGDNDPLSGVSSNPEESFIISITKGTVNLSKALSRLDTPEYSIYDKITGKVWDDVQVIPGSEWHAGSFGDFKISKDASGRYYMVMTNGSATCKFNGNRKWHLSESNGKVSPQQNTFNCGHGDYKIFVSRSDVIPRGFHVTMGKYRMKYEDLKNVIVRYYNNGWHECHVVKPKVKGIHLQSGKYPIKIETIEVFNIDCIKNVEVKEAVIFLDYADTHPFNSFYANECGRNMDNVKEGVYICIPHLSG